MQASRKVFARRFGHFLFASVAGSLVMACGTWIHLLVGGAELETVAGITLPAGGRAESLAGQALLYFLSHALGWAFVWSSSARTALDALGHPPSAPPSSAKRRAAHIRTMLAAGALVALGELACGIGAVFVLALIGMVGFTATTGSPHPWRDAAAARDEHPVTIVVLALAGGLMAGVAGILWALVSFGLALLGPAGYVLSAPAMLPVLVVFTYVLCCWGYLFVQTPPAHTRSVAGGT